MMIMQKHLSEEHKQKLSEANKGQIPWNKGLTGVYSKESLQKMSEAAKRRISFPCSEETKMKISEALKGEKNPNYGKHPSLEIRQKMSLAHKGKKLSEENKRKIGNANRGKIQSEETRKKRSHALLNNKNVRGFKGSINHQQCVKFFASLLDNTLNKIEIEKVIYLPNNHYRIIDVLANDNICFEIGRCRRTKIEELVSYGFNVINIPYSNFSGFNEMEVKCDGG